MFQDLIHIQHLLTTKNAIRKKKTNKKTKNKTKNTKQKRRKRKERKILTYLLKKLYEFLGSFYGHRKLDC